MSQREPFWAIDAYEVIVRLETDPDDGLRSAAALERLERYGRNVLATPHRTPATTIRHWMDKWRHDLTVDAILAQPSDTQPLESSH